VIAAEVLHELANDFLKNLAMLFLVLAIICGWIMNFTLKGF